MRQARMGFDRGLRVGGQFNTELESIYRVLRQRLCWASVRHEV